MPRVDRTAFRAMGTEVILVGPAGNRAFGRAAAVVASIFEREEHRFSRFRPESELSRVNATAGSWRRVSSGFAELIAFALEAWRGTARRFDPTVLDAVVAAGYDRDFDELIAGARAQLRPPRPCGRAGEIALDADRLRLPEGVGLDLGGVAKGWTVDLAAVAAADVLPWALVNGGGDLRLAGIPPAEPVTVAVEDPETTDGEVGRIALNEGALATSSTTRRAWGPGLHHLIDPSTGLPADGVVLQATVWAPRCADAEVASKDALLVGEPYLERGAALLVLRDGRIATNLSMSEADAA